VLNAQPDLEVVAQATDGEQAVVQALAENINLAILDISMPRKTGLQAAREITHRKPEVRVLMLSMHDPGRQAGRRRRGRWRRRVIDRMHRGVENLSVALDDAQRAAITSAA
jgi:chemotaxis response regulator CheB